MKSDKTLTELQYNFVLNYVKNGFNAYQAAINAGYAESVAKVEAHKILAKPQVREHLRRAYQRVEAKQLNVLCMTMQEKAKVLSRIIYDIVPKDKSQEPKRKHYDQAIKAIAELNKMSGDYAPDKRLSLTVDATKDKLEEVKRQYEDY